MARKYGKSKSHTFSQVPKAEIPRSSFDRTSTLKTAFNAADLVPIFVDEVLPGDTFNMNASYFGRLATPLKPILDNLYMEDFWFFIPNRLVWDNWEKFNGAQANPDDTTDYNVPNVEGAGAVQIGSIQDFMGLPLPANVPYNSLPFRGYNLVYNEWFRDQNLQNSVTVPTGDGPDTASTFALLKRGKRHDYFTSGLPWPQKGDPVTVPLGETAPIIGNPGQPTQYLSVRSQDDGNPYMLNQSVDGVHIEMDSVQAANEQGLLYADLASATGFTINQLRQSFQIQRLLERDARGGTRYIEILKSHFGVTSPDARLQRPEFLGGSSQMINISPVAQTSTSAYESSPVSLTPQGNLAGMGTVTGRSGFTKSFVEHGFVIGLVNVRADLTYQQGLNRLWSRRTRFDYYWPALSHLGEQAILNKEIFAQGTAQDDNVFAYQEAWGEYRYRPSQVTSVMRSDAGSSLDVWHLAQDFDNLPTLSAEFIEDNPPLDRVIAVPGEPHMLLDAYFKLRCARPMPLYGVPGLIDHF